MVPKALIEEIKKWVRERKYGNIQINFVNGRILTWNLHVSVKASESSTFSRSTTVKINGAIKK